MALVYIQVDSVSTWSVSTTELTQQAQAHLSPL